MPDDVANGVVSPGSARRAVEFLMEISPDLRGTAVLGPDGSLLAASNGSKHWAEDAAALLAAADAAGSEPVEQVHIGTEQGEVFAIRHEGLAAVAVTDRFALASLMLFDMRALLRDLAGGGDGRAE
jgi:predicted regulator of Ras-like GTPase activity (Roadblock/LC7/MglB family)